MLPRRSEERMHLDGALAVMETSPRKEGQTEVDRGRVERVDGVGERAEFETQVVVGIQGTCRGDERAGELLIDARVARFIGVRQRGPQDRAAAKPHVVELGLHHAKTGLDVAQAFAVGELRKRHRQELVETAEGLHAVVAAVSRHALAEFRQRQMVHQLGKHRPANIHMSTPKVSRTNYFGVEIDFSGGVH